MKGFAKRIEPGRFRVAGRAGEIMFPGKSGDGVGKSRKKGEDKKNRYPTQNDFLPGV
jgi:hypothetical protein